MYTRIGLLNFYDTSQFPRPVFVHNVLCELNWAQTLFYLCGAVKNRQRERGFWLCVAKDALVWGISAKMLTIMHVFNMDP